MGATGGLKVAVVTLFRVFEILKFSKALLTTYRTDLTTAKTVMREDLR